MRRYRWLWLFALLSLIGCGPSDQEVGMGVLISLPLVLSITYGVLSLLSSRWRTVIPELLMHKEPWTLALLASVLLMLITLIIGKEKAVSMFISGLWIFGSSYVSMALFVWRIWLKISPRTAFGYAFLLPLLWVLPAIPMMLGQTSRMQDVVLPFYVWPGYGGGATFLLFLCLMIEVGIKRRQSGKRSTH